MENTPLFNINGNVGLGAYETPEFPAVSDFVAHMDYLGVDRSLLWHVEARDMNPTWGNKRLLREIREAGAEDRVFPAFVITPACFFEDGALDFLKENLKSGAVRVLRIIPDVSRFPIRQIERVLAELAEFKPLVLWDCRVFSDELAMRDVDYLAATFPNVSFALTQKMWPGFGAILDLMWRHSNVFIDISWAHMRDIIELLRDEFGADRVLYGFGNKGHYGASIAALSHARISREERELIAHGNVERLLGIEPLEGKLAKNVPLLERKPLWTKFRSGKALDEVTIIDAHTHTGPHTRGWFLRDIDLETNIKNLVAQMDRNGVNRMIITPESALFGEPVQGNRDVEKAMEPYLDRFSGYLVFNPRYADTLTPTLDDFFSRRFYVGFKVLPSYWKIPVTDPGYESAWSYADAHRLPILLHTWDDSCNSPAMLTDIVKRFPNAQFLLGHSGGGSRGRAEAERLALDNDNVFLEFCGTFTTPVPFEDSARKVGFDKVVFGTDTGAHDQSWELGRYLSMPLPDEELEPGLATTIEKILKLR